jgi:hypothetical protein
MAALARFSYSSGHSSSWASSSAKTSASSIGVAEHQLCRRVPEHTARSLLVVLRRSSRTVWVLRGICVPGQQHDRQRDHAILLPCPCGGLCRLAGARGLEGLAVTEAVYGLASKTRLKGVSVARRKRVKPPAVTTSRMRASPACAPSASPTSCAFEAGVQIMVEAE